MAGTSRHDGCVCRRRRGGGSGKGASALLVPRRGPSRDESASACAGAACFVDPIVIGRGGKKDRGWPRSAPVDANTAVDKGEAAAYEDRGAFTPRRKREKRGRLPVGHAGLIVSFSEGEKERKKKPRR